MYISCKCLNVSIITRGNNELKDVKDGDIELSPAERADEFFNEKLVTVTAIEAIAKEQSGLVEVRNVESWIVNFCYNCSMYTHAVHREHGAAFVLINTNIIMSSAEVDKLRASPNYSPVFRIVIARNSLDDGDLLEPPTKFSVSQLSRAHQATLAALQQQLEEALQKESDATEEKIHAFTIEHYNILEKFRENAHDEHTRLARLICNHGKTAMATTSVETSPITTPDRVKDNLTTSIAQSASSKSPTASPGVITAASIRHQAATIHPSHLRTNGGHQKRDKLQVFCQEPKSYDVEALFPLEGMDDTLTSEQIPPSEDESEVEGHDEGIPIPKSMRSGHPTLTKSLPISIPAFRTAVRSTVQDEDDDEESRDPLDPHNIQASIKALAKSVHGDTVFGDLPKPRFSTQL